MPHQGQVTIKDMAAELGISPSTVSKALKNHPDISEETRNKVNELARKLNYNPNPIALSLRSSRTRTIGLVIPEIVHHFFSSVISGIEDVAYDAGYNVMIYQSNESFNRELIVTQALLNSRVEGMLISLSKETRNYDHLAMVIENGVPLVMFDRVCKELEADKVTVDDFEGAFSAVCHLVRTGCKRIAHLSGPPGLLIADHRRNGYLEALKSNNLTIDRNLLVFCDNYKQSLIRTRQLMSLPEPPDAFFTVNEFTAVGVLKALQESGHFVPGDVSVFAFSNGLITQVTTPTLSTVDQHAYQIGQTSVQMLLDRLLNKSSNLPFTEQVIRTQLIIRESTRRL